jgi:hypothetical protein
MRSPPAVSISLFAILVGLAWRVGQHLVAPGTRELGAVLIVCGTASLILAVRNLRRSLAAAAAVISLCGASTLALKHLAWHLHDIPVPPAISSLAGSLVPGAGSMGDLLTFWTGRGLETVRLTFEGLGLYEVWYIVVALLALAAVSRHARGARCIPANLGIVLAYAAVRFVVVTALAIEWDSPHLLWHPAAAIVSWLPLALLLRPPRPHELTLLPTGRSKEGAALAVTSALAGLVLAVVFAYTDPGGVKRGRILVDETHSNWEWTDMPFDTTSVGIRAEYNYCCLVDYLSHHYEVETSADGLSESLLDSVDVLVIKTPTEPFTPEELKTITTFVRSGGGLLLIGDHTNLFGMTDFLNPVAELFGMGFRYDDTFDLASTGLSVFKRPDTVFHPSLRGVDRFGFLTSCTAVGGAGIEPVMIGCGLGSEDVDYGHPNFFGNIAYDLCDRFGLFLQACSTRFGRGRVLLFTDSTCFSNFCLFGPGVRDLVVGFIDYLNREGTRYPWVRPIALAAFGVACALSVSHLGRVQGGLGWLSIWVCAGLAVGTCAVSRLNAAIHGLLPEMDVSPVVLFDTEHTEATLFDYLGITRERGSRGFEQFYLCARRIGMYPTAGGTADVMVSNPDGVVLIEPCTVFSEEELASLAGYVRRGGRLLVVDSVLNQRSTSNHVLGQFGMTTHLIARAADMDWVPDPADSSLERAAGGSRGVSDVYGVSPRLSIQGGEAVRRDSRGNTAVAAVRVGEGVVAVAVDSFRYSEQVLGPPLQTGKLTPIARARYRDACDLLKTVFIPDR